MVEIPRGVFEMEESLIEVRALLHRLDKGEVMLREAVKEKSMTRSLELAELFSKVAFEALESLENAHFMHETLTTGRTTVLDRKGRPATTMQFNPKEHRVVDLFTLSSMKKLKEVFGEEAVVEFETIP